MKIDIVINPVGLSPQQFIEAVATAEVAGFDAIWTYDHMSGAVLGGGAPLDVWTLLTLIATTTKRVDFGPLVINATTRHPAHIALAASTLANLSGGRFLLGLGAGAGPESPYAAELRMLGLPMFDAARRRTIVTDTTEYLRALWGGAPKFSSDTASFSQPDHVVTPCRVPSIMIGVNGPLMAAVAGRHADGINVHSWERDVASLIEVARVANDGVRPFTATVEGVLDGDWLAPHSDLRRDLKRLGANRIMLPWRTEMGLAAINDAHPQA